MRRTVSLVVTLILVAGGTVGCSKAEQPQPKGGVSAQEKSEGDWQPEAEWLVESLDVDALATIGAAFIKGRGGKGAAGKGGKKGKDMLDRSIDIFKLERHAENFPEWKDAALVLRRVCMLNKKRKLTRRVTDRSFEL